MDTDTGTEYLSNIVYAKQIFIYGNIIGHVKPGGGGGGGARWSTVYRCVNKGPKNLP